MGLFFIFMTLLIGIIFISLILQDIKIELKYRNQLLEEQNEIIKCRI
jgi:hypothetical protein